MKISQIYLQENQIKSLRKKAFKSNATVSEVIQNTIKEKFFLDLDTENYMSSGDLLLDIAKIAKNNKHKAPKDLASQTDKYLY